MRSTTLPVVLILALAGCVAQPPSEVQSATIPTELPPPAIELSEETSVVSIPAGGWAVVQIHLDADDWTEEDGGGSSFVLRYEFRGEEATMATWWLDLDGNELSPSFLGLRGVGTGGLGHSTSEGPRSADLVCVVALTPESPGVEFAFALGDGELSEGVPASRVATGEGAMISAYGRGIEPMNVEVTDTRTRVSTPRGDLALDGKLTLQFEHTMQGASMHGFDVYIGNTNVANWAVSHAIDDEASADSGMGIWPNGPAMYAQAAGVGAVAVAELVLDTTVSLSGSDSLVGLTLPWDPQTVGWTLDEPLAARGSPIDRYELW